MRFNKYHWSMIILIFLFIGLSIYYPLSKYELLPDQIPTHFGISGEPDAWSNKSVGTLLLGPFITLPTLLIMLPIIWWIATIDDPRKIINGPREKIQKMSPERAEEVRQTTVFHLLIIMLLVAVLIMVISVKQVSVALGSLTTLGPSVPIIVILLLGDTIYFAWKVIRLVNK